MLVGALACVVVAAPVFAFVSRSTHMTAVRAPLTVASSTATCPAGQHVLFGGFDVSPPRSGRRNQSGIATGMRRTANDRWTVDAFNAGEPTAKGVIGPSPPLSVSSMAYCGFGPVPSKATSTVQIRIGRRASGSATARCPAGTVVVAGGFASTAHSLVAVTGLERVAADQWRVTAYLPAAIAGSTVVGLTSVAYCGPGPAPKLASRTIKSPIGGTARATCPVGTTLAFGGAIVPTGSAGSDITYLKTLRAETQSRWSAGGVGGKLTALAYCR